MPLMPPSQPGTPSGPDAETLLVLGMATVLMAGSLILGPAALVLSGLCLSFALLSNRHRTGWVLSGSSGLVLASLSARAPDDPFWRDRLNLVRHLFTTPDGFRLWISDLNICVESVSGGFIMAALILLGLEFRNLSPYRRIARKLAEERRLQRTSVRARFAIRRINSQPAATRDNRTLLGVHKNTGASITLPDTSLNTHMLIAGTTGSGKTVSLLNIVESFIDRNHPVIFIDGKGDLDLMNRIIAYACDRNRPAWRFSMAGPSCIYNPLTGNYTALKDRIICLRREWSEEHYLKLAEGFLQTVFKVLQRTGQSVSLVTMPQMLDLDRLVTLVRTAVRNHTLSDSEGLGLMAEIARQQEASRHVESLRAELLNLAHSHLGSLFDPGEAGDEQDILELPNVITRDGVACFSLTPMIYPEVAGVIGRLILNDLKSALDPLAPKKILLVIDEVSTLVSTRMLNFLNQGRFAGLHIVLTVQSIADLGQKIPGNAELFIRQILSNCNVFLIHKLNAQDDTETIAAMSGTRLAIEHTAQIAGFGLETGLGSARLVHEYLVHPDHIKCLGRGEAVLIDKNTASGVTPLLVRKGKLIP